MPSSDKNPVGEILINDMQIKELTKGANLSPTHVPKGGTVSRVGGQNIVTVDMPKEQLVTQFEPGKIHDSKGLRYSDVVKGIPDSTAKKYARFRLSELSRGPLSVEAEEEERVESEVQRRLQERMVELRAQTMADAYQEGFSAGKDAGNAEVFAQSAPKLKAFDMLIAEFEGMRGEVFKANEVFLVHLVHQMAKAVILRELKDDGEYSKRLALHLIERCGTRENIKIFISQAEQSSAETLKAGLAQSLGALKNVSIEVDEAIKDGGCRVETEFGEVDGRIEVQLRNIALGLGLDQK